MGVKNRTMFSSFVSTFAYAWFLQALSADIDRRDRVITSGMIMKLT
ncbi:MAG: hypothetical protein ACXV2E_07275 [Halobacteriota archaeon]